MVARIFQLLLASALGFLSGCSLQPTRHPVSAHAVKTSFTVTRDVVYTPQGWPVALHADVYRPVVHSPAPAVLLIHGGGWEGSDRRWQMKGIAAKLAKRGYVVVNATYRMAPAYTYPSPVEDLQQAIKWMEKNAVAQGINRNRIATFGYSAGGHLAALVGLENPHVKAIVAGGTPSDLMLFNDGPLVEQFMRGKRAQVAARYKAASPVNHITSHSPPVFIYHGGADKLVPPEHAIHFKAALDKHHVPNEIQWLDGKSHISAFLLPEDSIENAIRFLDGHLR